MNMDLQTGKEGMWIEGMRGRENVVGPQDWRVG